jgi:hypothetical protein
MRECADLLSNEALIVTETNHTPMYLNFRTITVAAVFTFAAQMVCGVPPMIPHTGMVRVNGVPFDGIGKFKFAIVNAGATQAYWNSDGTHGIQIEPALTVSVVVARGQYGVSLGDGVAGMSPLPLAAFTQNDDLFLRVWFDDGVHGVQLLFPDHRIASVGYALVAGATSPNAIGTAGVADGSLEPIDLNLPSFAGVFWRLTGNPGTNPGSDFLGTTDDQPLHLAVGGRRTLRLEPTIDPLGNSAPNIIGGATVNSVGSGVHGTVAGGWVNIAMGNGATVGGGIANTAAGDNSTVAGGADNTAAGIQCTVGGGRFNQATGAFLATIAGGQNHIASGTHSTISGGDSHIASGSGSTVGGGFGNSSSADYATASGGLQNTASGFGAVVAGGRENSATGSFAAIPGGFSNSAGSYSFAAGRRAKAIHSGSFVWADSGDVDFASTAPDQFLIRASSGVGIGTSAPSHPLEMASGAHVTAGGTWSNSSDRSRKTNFKSVDPEVILSALSKLEISEWSYRTEEPVVRHLGPTSQDFMAAFNLGADNTSITTIDADGVALASIQALHRLLKDRDRELAELRLRLTALEARMSNTVNAIH